ncbi:OLC1v1031947C1 [Oldenlandia corymbosa var. corymbosa]|uniref:OLC1v1031947C1 n=1 Tax=Oldenlandia corymbosa var. corymbosa TaxID=529605 RepID=A0AAV1CLQ9_OLDCO|nr:OLC1v1031947C1 [Oldenlandia corymbosa var. corymbosa]
MDAKPKASQNSGEISMVGNKKASEEVIVTISEDEKDPKNLRPDASKDQRSKLAADSPARASNGSPRSTQKVAFSSPENSSYSPSPNKPPKIPTTDTLTRRKTLARSLYSKPKSRFGEQSVPVDVNANDEVQEQVEASSTSPYRNVSNQASPINGTVSSRTNSVKETVRAIPITPKTPLMASPGFGGVDEDEEIYKKVNIRNKLRYKRVKAKVLVEWFVFLCILGCLIASLTVHKLRHWTMWSLEIWKWCALVLVTVSGLLFTKWFVLFVVLLIELNFLLRKKVLYFVYALRKSVQVCLWFGVVLVTWILLFRKDVQRSHLATKILDYITWTIVTLLIGAVLWLIKTLLLKILASSFHVNAFFDRIQESVFHQYILLTLSGPPVMDSAGMVSRTNSNTSQFSFRTTKVGKDGKEKEKKEVIDMNKLHMMKREKVSAWTMKMLVDVISNSGLTTISSALTSSIYDGANEQSSEEEITNEEEAIAAAYHIFRNVAQPGCKYIDELDLRRFMIKEEVDLVFPMIDVAETGRIDRKALTDWVVQVYNGRKALGHALNDTKTAVKQLNKLVTAVLIIIMIIVWLLLLEIATTKVLLFMSSQLVVAAFMFGNTCKTIFEAIIFVFVMHPFDVGDRCVVDGVQMIVEEMNILTTVFLRYDNEKIFYPNSVLATKPISNFYRSPDMGDSFEFSIDFKTPLELIGTLKEKIKMYLESNPSYWHPNHNVVVKEIENVNKIKMALFFNHTMNFQNFGEKNRRRSELVLEMKRIFEQLNIKYDLLPQEHSIWKEKEEIPLGRKEKSMDPKPKSSKNSGEINMVGNKIASDDEVIVVISEDEKDPKRIPKPKLAVDSPARVSNDSPRSTPKAMTVTFSSPDNTRFIGSPHKPPRIPRADSLTKRNTLARSLYSKPKSRFGEQPVPVDVSAIDEGQEHVELSSSSPYRNLSNQGSPINKMIPSRTNTLKETVRSVPITPKTPLMGTPSFGGVDEDEEIYKKVSIRNKLRYNRIKVRVFVEWFVFFCVLGCFIASLIVHRLQHWTIWRLEIWKWCALVMVTVSGMLFTKWLVIFAVLLIELNFLLRKKVLYFVHALKQSVQVFLWLSLVLVTWVLLFRKDIERSPLATRILDSITWTLVALVIGTVLWLIKTLLLKILASSFHVNAFFDRIQESVFHQYVLMTLSGTPVLDSAGMVSRTNSTLSQFSVQTTKVGKDGKEKKMKQVIDMNKLHEMKREKVSAFTMKMLVDMISNTGLTTISSTLATDVYGGGHEQSDKEINNEEEAIAAAYHIFKNVAQPSSKYIDEYDLRRFMIKEEVDLVFPMIDVAETGRINRKTLTEWVVKVYNGRKALGHALNDTKSVVRQLNKIVSVVLIIIVIVVWLLLTEIATTKVIVFMSSQLVVLAFMFGNTCKTMFEAIIFVFVMHPFDVGDRCVVDGVQMIVEEMNIFTTVFLRYDNEKIFYPNSVLATKPISNFYRSPDMGDEFLFCIDYKTPLKSIGTLKEKIKNYLESNPAYWHPNHNVVVKEIENVNKIKMALYFNHTMNFQNFPEKNRRRSELILEMKKIFDELDIKYDLLPQEVHLVELKSKAMATGTT